MRKPSWIARVAMVVAAVGMACSGGEKDPSETTGRAPGKLLGDGGVGSSTFESGDGDLAPNTSTPIPAPHDWNNPVEPIVCPASAPGAGTNCGLDLVKNGSDNSLGQGSKEDAEVPTIVSGQIPPSKDDLSRFYVNKERVGGKDFLYLAWERSNLLGSAHMDFEFNQDSTLTTNGVTPKRTPGDLLIDFDFGGSGVPVLAKHTWITTGNPASCEASNTLPCWDKAVTLTGSFVEAQVNSAPVTDTNPPGAPRTLDGNTKNGINATFGEAGINLTDSNIFPPNTCTHFGKAWLKSRSSGNSFNSELKDFIAPISVDISNCGTIKIIKQTSPPNDAGSFSFSFTHNVGSNSDPVVASPFTLVDGGEQDFFNVQEGTYTFTETQPNGFDLSGISCTVTGAGGSTYNTSGSPTLSITLKADDTVVCTFTNSERLGAIKVTKTRKDAAEGSGPHPQAGVSFTVNGVTKQTDANGVVCFDRLPWAGAGTAYTVQETVPAGYVSDGTGAGNNNKTVTVDNDATCSDDPYGGETVGFLNTPLTDIRVSATSLAGAGVTNTTVVCCVVPAGGTTCDPSVSADGGVNPTVTLQDGVSTRVEQNALPGTYICKFVVDP